MFTEYDVVYAHASTKPLSARIYRPTGPGPFPCIVEVHGGAWTSGDRLRNAPLVAQLARSGILVMSVDFRMPPDATYPASIADIHLAIRWLKAHAVELSINPARVGGLGTSSGGHQVVLTALRPGRLPYGINPLVGAEALDAQLAFVIACWPILDPPQRFAMARAKARQDLVNGHNAFWVTEAAMTEGSPQRIVDAGEADAMPPLLVIQGRLDDNVDHTTIDHFARSYRNSGGSIEVHKFDEPHGFIGKDLSAPNAVRAVDLIREFVFRLGSDNNSSGP